MVFIDPYFNHTAGLFSDKWLAPRLGTDVALALAIAHTWLTEGTYNKDYVADRTTGFSEWTDYVLGKADGLAKTPEWAEGESGVPPERYGLWHANGRRRRPCSRRGASEAWAAHAAPPRATNGRGP